MWQIISLKIVITHSTVILYLGIYSMEIGFPIVREILFTKSKALLISYKKVLYNIMFQNLNKTKNPQGQKLKYENLL